MALQTINVGPLDPNIFTGPTRMTGGVVVRTLTPTPDVAYGTNGTIEYMQYIYVGVTGNVSYVKWDGTTQALVGLLGGQWHRIASIKINSVGTTATGIVVGS